MAEIAVIKLLENSYKKLQNEPVEGFLVIPDAQDYFTWKIFIEGPPDTVFETGIFELCMEFPNNYPMMPPSLRFVSEFWHPNVYPDGRVCISILHNPGEDIVSGESAGERWLPSQTVTSVVISVMSMLNDPNFSSPANVDASVECRNNYKKYKSRIKKLVAKSIELNGDVQIPHPETNPEEKKMYLERQKIMNGDDLWNDDCMGFDDISFESADFEFGSEGSMFSDFSNYSDVESYGSEPSYDGGFDSSHSSEGGMKKQDEYISDEVIHEEVESLSNEENEKSKKEKEPATNSEESKGNTKPKKAVSSNTETSKKKKSSKKSKTKKKRTKKTKSKKKK
eukprot:TRINITY_DN5111_c0_g1_i1.p1 TRINITY_DN5111_c0_g1~~TRINITY_DN5111_c0_g1_i1.p1  ORF type:complete len:338 (+),score=86.94 TRINITY_DN5111_c0_g1_i1:50-1063(+)